VSVTLNHTIVWCRDKKASARYLTEVLGLEDAKPWGPFMVVEMGNGVTLDYYDFYDSDGEILSQRYAFLVTEDGFDEMFGRVQAGDQDHWADPGLSAKSEINHNDGGRGVYFRDPDKHLLEIITRPTAPQVRLPERPQSRRTRTRRSPKDESVSW
jgi:catechol 2,3-dioxygenase-like lactoylglutathione lyase family enzyme